MEDLIAEHVSPGRAPDADPQALGFEYPKEAIVSYAQTREDVLLWRALHNVHRGFYIDVGAHDPTTLSVTRAFYDHGWHGINVEPDPLYAEKLRKERPRDVTLEVALSHSPGMATIYEFGDAGLSTLVKEIADGHMAAGFKATERRVLVTTLAALLDDLGDQQVHFLKIDVEGYERQVLLGANFANVRPWIVLLEAVRPTTTEATYGSWEPLMLEAGYKFAYFDGLNRYYIAEEHPELRRYFSVPVSICDPFRDGEVVRLSAAVTELERDSVRQASLVGRLSGVMADLELDRMTQANEVVRLREIVAELEHGKDAQANEAVRLREIVAELEHGKDAQASEVVRLSAVISKLQRVHVKHEVPRLGGSSETPIASGVEDATGLLRVVETQASDLVRLRRALVSAQAVAAQRLQVINDVANARARADREEGKVFEWVRSIVLGEVARIQDAIVDVIEWSRWRRIGHRLRLAKRLSWETGNWQTDLSEAPAGSAPNTDGRTVSMAELLVELERLNKLLDHMRLSRWRKLGHWLGLVKRLPWESGTWRDPLLLKPFPDEEAGLAFDAGAIATTAHFNYSGFAEYANECFLGACRSFATDVILDVGANTGQFAKNLRASGYHGHIISFEPLSSAHAILASAATSDSLWDVAERCAVGASDSWTTINIAGNSYSSSLLPMLDLHREAAPEIGVSGNGAVPRHHSRLVH